MNHAPDSGPYIRFIIIYSRSMDPVTAVCCRSSLITTDLHYQQLGYIISKLHREVRIVVFVSVFSLLCLCCVSAVCLCCALLHSCVTETLTSVTAASNHFSYILNKTSIICQYRATQSTIHQIKTNKKHNLAMPP